MPPRVRRRGDPSGLRLPQRKRRLRRGLRGRAASPSSDPRRTRCAPSASSTPRAPSPRKTACPSSPARTCCRRDEAVEAAGRIGYPVMLKSTAGGGGIGMRLCRDDDALARRLRSRRAPEPGQLRRSRPLPREVRRARPPHRSPDLRRRQGQRLALGERDCSAQRRNRRSSRKPPRPAYRRVRPLLRSRRADSARAVSYRSAGTVEFIYDADTGAFYFLEVNTRLQVEHGVTEEVTRHRPGRVDGAQAAGELPSLPPSRHPAATPSRSASTPKTRRRTSSPAPASSPK